MTSQTYLRLRAVGFAEVQTGGGCTALRRDYDDGSFHLITLEGGCAAPTPDTPDEAAVMVGYYDADGELDADDYSADVLTVARDFEHAVTVAEAWPGGTWAARRARYGVPAGCTCGEAYGDRLPATPRCAYCRHRVCANCGVQYCRHEVCCHRVCPNCGRSRFHRDDCPTPEETVPGGGFEPTTGPRASEIVNPFWGP